MASSLGGVTAKIVEYALDGLSLRHTAIATNIANANSVGYRPVQVSFERALAGLVESAGSSAGAVDNLPKPAIVEATDVGLATGSNSVEAQTVLLNQNVMQHQALITGLNRYISTLAIAINEGKR